MSEFLKNYSLKFKPTVNIDEIWEILTASGITVLYSDENARGAKEIYIQLPAEEDIDKLKDLLPGLLSIEPQTLPDIDWNEQWQLHGHDFHEGKVHIRLSDYGFISDPHPSEPSRLILQPGPGFGDLSHPTTALVLELMANQVKGQTVVDIGCGSGVLALAAIAMGADRVLAVDIDPEALEHTRRNALLNHMDASIQPSLPEDLGLIDAECVVLINMISSEQCVAWESVKNRLPKVKKILSSGIRDSEKNAYLALASLWRWKEIRCLEKEQWLGFEFVSSL
jgi:ribosomal protein L11 methyltransferase